MLPGKKYSDPNATVDVSVLNIEEGLVRPEDAMRDDGTEGNSYTVSRLIAHQTFIIFAHHEYFRRILSSLPEESADGASFDLPRPVFEDLALRRSFPFNPVIDCRPQKETFLNQPENLCHWGDEFDKFKKEQSNYRNQPSS